MEEKILSTLSADRLFYVGITEVIKRQTSEIPYCDDSSFIVRDKISGVCMLYSKDEKSAAKALESVKYAKMFATYQEHGVKLIQNKYKFGIRLVVHQAAYFDKKNLLYDESLDIRPLGIEYLDFIMKNYGVTDRQYIAGRLKTGEIYGAFVGEEIAGFIGTHEEGSMGMLKILEKYRRQQLGYNLAAFLTNKTKSRGDIPFSQIEIDNPASFYLHKKLNFQISDKIIYWLY